ncbi:MAG: OmpA family protein [Myxococcota bacterium]
MRALVLALSFALFGSACGGALANRFNVRIEGDRVAFDQHINFAFDSAEILDDSAELLDAIAAVLREHEEIATVRVDGHTDSTGDDDHNMELSERRAASVVAALRERGVEQQLASRGLGETAPLCTDESEACHARNRRVELVIVARNR